MKQIKAKGSTQSDSPTDSPLLTAALEYAGRGWRVFPVTPGCKRPPKVQGWPERATTDPAQLTRWWKEFPQANIGMATGVASGVVVIDVDRHGRVNGFSTLEKLQTEHGKLPLTLTALTPGGGKHLFFKALRKVKSCAGFLGPGIDVRGEGGYVVLAPSVVKGGTYAWAN